MTHKYVRQSSRSFVQKIILDPLTGLVALIIWEIFRFMPPHTASKWGAKLGTLIGKVMKRRSHIGLVNLKIAFPEKTDLERQEILDKMWKHWGRFFAEMPHAAKLFEEAKFNGAEHLKKIKASGKGGFVCSAHLGNWELAVSHALFDDVYLNPVYRKANNPWLERLMFKRRTGILIPKGESGARKIVEVIHHKGFVVMLCDQKLREGISVPFFGKEAMTAPAIAVLALKLNVPIVMARSIRQPDGTFIMEITEPIEVPQEKDIETTSSKMMTDINNRLEKWIRETPEQWLWIHRRFEKSIYELDVN